MRFPFPIVLPSVALLCAHTWPVYAETAVPELYYESVFDEYRAYQNPEIKDWSRVNQLVGEIGGWRAYAREPAQVLPEKGAAELPKPSPSVEQHQHGAKP